MIYISIDGPFDVKMGYRVVKQIEAAAKTPEEDVFITICSYGGDVSVMLGIEAAINRAPNKVHTLVAGTAMSAGFLVSISGDQGCRYVMPNATIMAHNPIGGADLDTDMDMMEAIAMIQYRKMSEVTNLSHDEIKEMLRTDTYLTPQQAVDLGLYDAIVN